MNATDTLARQCRVNRLVSGMRAALAIVVLFISGGTLAQETALDRYVAEPDAAYEWRVVSRHPAQSQTTFVLELTSQRWRTDAEVDRPTWKHWLVVVRPDRIISDAGFLYIGGGSNRDDAPTDASDRILRLAVETGTVAAELFTVPNQPLTFADSPSAERSEDDLVAYSRVRYIETRDPTWLVRLAMVKSGVRAMDAVQEFMASDEGGQHQVKRFVVAGASKRGWTTWLVGAVDPRVVGIAPLVIDALNSEMITRHHYRAYGFFSPALDDYVRHGPFPDKVGTPEYREILAIEDPFNYRQRERLRIPKYIVNSAGDQFFLPDNSRFYFSELAEEKYLRYVPNTKHSLAGSDARDTLQAFYEMVAMNRPRPKIAWEREERGWRVRSEQVPREVLLWQAHNPEARDFRLDTIGPAWTSEPLLPNADGEYEGLAVVPERGFTACFVELTYDSGGRYSFKCTTEVQVVPDRLPYEFPEIDTR